MSTEPGLESNTVTVLVVDDHQAVRDGLARLISCSTIPLRCVGAVGSGAEALIAATLHRPAVIVLDVDLGGEDGLALIPKFVPWSRVLVLTCHGDAATKARATTCGASAFVEKHEPAAVLLRAIFDVGYGHSGGEPCTPQEGPRSHVLGAASSALPFHWNP